MDKINMRKSGRVLYLYGKLSQGHLLKKSELAEQFNVNERSIQRDLDTIKEYLAQQRIEEGYSPQLFYDFKLLV